MSAGSAGRNGWELHGSGPAVVLIHGFGLNRAMWQWQLPALTPHFSVLTYDLLGHGESARPTGTPDLAMFSAQLLGLMDCSGIARAAVAGFSLGGMIARRFALDHPDRLSALAILHSPHDRSPAQRDAVRKRVRQTEAQGPSANLEPALERWFTPAFRAEEPEAIALVRTWITRNDPAVYPQIYRVLAEGDAEIARGLERIACPTLVMTGENDPATRLPWRGPWPGSSPPPVSRFCRVSGTWRSPNRRRRSTSHSARSSATRSVQPEQGRAGPFLTDPRQAATAARRPCGALAEAPAGGRLP